MTIPKIIVDPASAGVVVTDPDPSVSVIWDQAVQAAVIETSPGPTIGSRAYAVVHTAIFEAWAAFDEAAIGTATGDKFQRTLAESTEENKAEAMSYAAFFAAKSLFPELEDMFIEVLEDQGYTATEEDISAFGQLGMILGGAVHSSFLFDGSNQLNDYASTADYEPVNADPDSQVSIEHWTPEYVPIDSSENLQSFLTPHWGDVELFARANEREDVDAPKSFFADTIDASLDMQAGTITLYGMSEGATFRDFREMRKDLRDAYRGTEEWGEVREFIRDVRKNFLKDKLIDEQTINVSKKLIGPVINEEFIAQAEDLIETSANLSIEDKRIAEFWEDGKGTAFPPGTWMTFGQFVSARDDNTLDEDAQMFFALSNAVFDAGIRTWDIKEEYDYARPVAVIRDLGELGLIGEMGTDYLGNEGMVIDAWAGPGLGTQTILVEDFITYQNPLGDPSPPFAEYTSGHSSFSAAAAEVLRMFTGSDEFGASVDLDFLLFEPTPADAPVTTLEWDTFSEAADEAGQSRIFGAIHFEDGDVNGRELGTEIGANVWEEAQEYIMGTADDFVFV